ncbi:MAG: PAAR domain-containing protein [Candidatus Obscuribacterales bacterium]
MTSRLLSISLLLLQLAISPAYAQDRPPSSSRVDFSLVSAVGKSPRVFTSGWPFEARCKVDGKDMSDQILWSGTGAFQPKKGRSSYPTFKREGENLIKLSIPVGEKTESRTFKVYAVSPSEYAYVGCLAKCDQDSHGCMSCPHVVEGLITTGSPKVLINNRPAARVGDIGTHLTCCGPGTFTIEGGDYNVLIDGRRAARFGDATRHCGGVGMIKGAFDFMEGTFEGSVGGQGHLTITVSGTRVTGNWINKKDFGGLMGVTRGSLSGSIDRDNRTIKMTMLFSSTAEGSIGGTKVNVPPGPTFQSDFTGRFSEETHGYKGTCVSSGMKDSWSAVRK